MARQDRRWGAGRPVKYYLDEHLSPVIAEICRDRYGLDILSTEECGNKQLSDEQQLLFAAGQGRCLVSADRDDFADITAAFVARNLPHAGILMLSPALKTDDYARIAAALARHDREHPDGVPAFMFDYLSRS